MSAGWAAYYGQYMHPQYAYAQGYYPPPGYGASWPQQPMHRPPMPLPPPRPDHRSRWREGPGMGRMPRNRHGDKGKGKGKGKWQDRRRSPAQEPPKTEAGEEAKAEGEAKPNPDKDDKEATAEPKSAEDKEAPPKAKQEEAEAERKRPPAPPPAPPPPPRSSRRQSRWEKAPTMNEVLQKYEQEMDEQEEEELHIPVIPLRCDIQGQGLGDKRRFRATHADSISAAALGITQEGGKHQVVGPWRLDRDDAVRDGERLKEAADIAGAEVYFAAMLVEAVGLHRQAEPDSVPAGVLSFELQQRPPIAGFGQSQHRVFCRVETPDDAGKTGVVEFPTPWRAKTNLAEEDLWLLFSAYQVGGYNNVKRVINNLNQQLRLFC